VDSAPPPAEGASTEWWYLSCRRFTVAVAVRDGLVVEGPPIVRRYVGKPAKQLGAWARSSGSFKTQRLEEGEATIVAALLELVEDAAGA
jgi:hypothetical protein